VSQGRRAKAPAPERIRLGRLYVGRASFLEALLARDPAAERALVRQLREDVANNRDDAPGLFLVQDALRAKILDWLGRKWFRGDPETALEVWNDTLLRVWLRVTKFDENKSSIVTWIHNQAKYAALDAMRRRRKGDSDQEEKPPEGGEDSAAEPGLSRRGPSTPEEWEAWDRAYEHLGETERLLLLFRYVLGYRNVEIARDGLAGRPLPEEQVRVYVHRAAKRLRTLYAKELERGSDEGGRHRG
jgi:RNA polymerase sigma factor (sigma-70 family)